MKDIKMTQIKLLLMNATIHQWQQYAVNLEIPGGALSLGCPQVVKKWKKSCKMKNYWIGLMKDQMLHRKKKKEWLWRLNRKWNQTLEIKLTEPSETTGLLHKEKYTCHYDSWKGGKGGRRTEKIFFKNFKLCWNFVKIINL